MAPGRDQPAGVGPSVDPPQSLQEPSRQGLHTVALVDRPLLGADAPLQPGRIRHHLTGSSRRLSGGQSIPVTPPAYGDSDASSGLASGPFSPSTATVRSPA